MNSADLAVFLHIADVGSLSRCAIETDVSVSVLSRRIAALETRLGTRLFHRSGRGVVLTEHGRRLAEHARRLQADIGEIERDMQGLVVQGPKSVIIAAQPTVAKTAFAAIGKALAQKFPGIRIRFREGLGGHIQEWVSGGEVDIALLYSSGHISVAAGNLILREHLCFVVPAAFGDEFPEGFPSSRLHAYPLVLPSAPHGLRLLAHAIAAAGGNRLDIAMECDASVYITKQLVAEGCGCTILPLASVYEEVARGELRAFRMVDPDVVREVSLICGLNRPPMARQWEVLQLIKAEVHRLIRDDAWPGATAL